MRKALGSIGKMLPVDKRESKDYTEGCRSASVEAYDNGLFATIILFTM